MAGTIARRGGPLIQRESDDWVRQHGPVSHAAPAYTGGGDLPCRYVIHAVGPVWGDGDEDDKLRLAVQGSLALAGQLGLASIALPAISTGIFGFPRERAAEIILNTIDAFLKAHLGEMLKVVRVVIFDELTLQAFLRVWTSLLQSNLAA